VAVHSGGPARHAPADEASGRSASTGTSPCPTASRLTTMSVADWQAAGAGMPADRAAAIAAAATAVGSASSTSRRGRAHRAGPASGCRVRTGARHGHLLIRVGRHATRPSSSARGPADYSEVSDDRRRRRCALTVVTLQEWDDDAIHLGQHDVVVGRDAQVRHIAVTLGGAIVRLNTNARMPARAAPSRRSASTSPTPVSTWSTGSSSTTRCRTARSNVEYKGALQGDSAHTVWVGDVLIRAAAEGTDTYELNRNLLLTDGARADSVPNLEIETGRDRGRRTRLCDRPLRRRAAVLPAGPRDPRGRGAPPGRAGLLRRASSADRVPEVHRHLMAGHRRRARDHPPRREQVTA
jgi:Fe-S cluster assembly protein SufD